MTIISGKSNFFSALWGRITLPFQQPKFEKTINLLKPALQGSNFSKMLDAVKTIDTTVKQNLRLANQKTLDVFKPMLQDGSEGAIRIIGILVEHNPELATQETLDLLKPILDGTLPLGLTVRLNAIRTTEIIYKKNPALATHENLALFNAAIEDGSFSEMVEIVGTVDTILKQNPKLATQKTLDVFKPMLQLKDGNYAAVQIIGTLVEQNSKLATQETLDLLKPILDGTLPLGLTLRLNAIRTADIIFKKNPDLATEKNLALFNAVIEDGNFQEMVETKITIATIFKQNPALGPLVTSDEMIIKSWSDQVKDTATAYIEEVQLAGQKCVYSNDLATVE